MKTLSKKTLIVGMGNLLSGDDRFGPQVLELLRQNGTDTLPGISFADAHTDLLNYLESFAEYDYVVLVDAILDPENKLGQPGRIVVLNEEAFKSWPETSQGVHQISPLLAVKLFRRIYPAALTQITLVGLCVDQITQAPRYATDERIQEGFAAVRAAVANL